jgi:hypothetical protein
LVVVIVPREVLPPTTPFTLQTIAADCPFEPETTAVKTCAAPVEIFALEGEMLTLMFTVGDEEETVADPDVADVTPHETPEKTTATSTAIKIAHFRIGMEHFDRL